MIGGILHRSGAVVTLLFLLRPFLGRSRNWQFQEEGQWFGRKLSREGLQSFCVTSILAGLVSGVVWENKAIENQNQKVKQKVQTLKVKNI